MPGQSGSYSSVKASKKKPWLAWVGGIALCLLVPGAVVGKSAWSHLAANIGSNKSFLTTTVKDHYDGKNVDTTMTDSTRKQSKAVLDDAAKQMGKFLEFDSADTIPSFSDVLNSGNELTYNLPVHFEKGYKTFTFRVNNEGPEQKILWITSADGITARNSIKRNIKERLH